MNLPHAKSTVLFLAATILCAAFCQCGKEEPAPTPPDTSAAPVPAPAQSAPKPAEEAPAPLKAPTNRVVILGFDGVEPTIIDALMEAGEVPALSKLKEQGTYKRLKSSNPPQSPTAWSSFITCKNPGHHGIYDFLRRDPARYGPEVGFGLVKRPELAADGALAKPADYENNRHGDSFWNVANRQGARCKILSVPFAYRADELDHGCQLCGLDVKDLRDSTSTFFLMSDSFTAEQLKGRLSGGMRLPLEFQDDTATVTIPGVRDLTQRRTQYIEVPLKVVADREAHRVAIDLPSGEKISLAENTWSEWIEWQFQVTDKFTVHGISRIHVLEAGEQVRMYMTCLQYHPKHPYVRFSTPEEYSGELADRYGLYKTIGWIYDTHALRQDALTEDLFLDDVDKTMAWRETLTLDEIDRGKFNLLLSAWTATDRVAHLFWRFRDPKHPAYTKEGAAKYGRAVEDTYIKMDEIVGKAMDKLEPDDLLIVMSDHGFHSFRMGFNINTWLIRNGYLAVEGQDDPSTAYNDKAFLRGYDWSKTKAYSLGLGSVYLNIKGREGKGTVEAADAPALRQEIKEKLLTVTDPDTGDRVLRAVYTREEAYQGGSDADTPDLELGYNEGYQSTKSAAKGAAPKDLFEPNTDKWSGEHAASDVDFTPGIFFCNRPVDGDPSLIDLGVTALEFLELEVPEDFEGKGLGMTAQVD
jgi:predicted AlkP superfamily phosphohydrolase/phosphomutase